MAAEADPVDIKGQLDVRLPNGEVYRVRPGPYGKGIAVACLQSAKPSEVEHEPGRRGRKPRPSTVKLRQKLERDGANGRLGDNRHYVQWMLKHDDTISLAVARQVVYRERKKHL